MLRITQHDLNFMLLKENEKEYGRLLLAEIGELHLNLKMEMRSSLIMRITINGYA